MLKYSLLFLFCLFSINAPAQEMDSIFAVRNGQSWAVKYTVGAGETVPMLATRFYLSEGTIYRVNGMDEDKKIMPGTQINIPVASKNYHITKPNPNDIANYHEIYYRVIPKDDIEAISMYAGVSKADMRKWNNLKGNTVVPGQVLFIGWIKMVSKDPSDPLNELAYFYPKKKPVGDSAKVIAIGGLDTIYNRQTNNGINVLNEKGTAVFFEKPGKITAFCAFHNSTPRGSVIKVYNPGNGRTIYVKVLGPLPNTKLYANSIIGICNAAKEALGVTDSKAWCELTYSTN